MSAAVRGEIRQSKPFRSIEEESLVALILTTDLVVRRLAEVIEPSGITHQQYNVLRILRGSHPEPLPTLEIAARMIEQTPGITRLIDRLEAKGLVTRERGSDDRRCVYCAITPAGHDMLAGLERPVRQVAKTAFAGLDEVKQRRLLAALDAVRAAVRGSGAG
jgi:DNA-binding MarR family transcriptional regulator